MRNFIHKLQETMNVMQNKKKPDAKPRRPSNVDFVGNVGVCKVFGMKFVFISDYRQYLNFQVLVEANAERIVNQRVLKYDN